LAKLAGNVLSLCGLMVFEQPRIDRQSSHIIHNTAFA
jgi:hypothetical protein